MSLERITKQRDAANNFCHSFCALSGLRTICGWCGDSPWVLLPAVALLGVVVWNAVAMVRWLMAQDWK